MPVAGHNYEYVQSAAITNWTMGEAPRVPLRPNEVIDVRGNLILNAPEEWIGAILIECDLYRSRSMVVRLSRIVFNLE